MYCRLSLNTVMSPLQSLLANNKSVFQILPTTGLKNSMIKNVIINHPHDLHKRKQKQKNDHPHSTNYTNKWLTRVLNKQAKRNQFPLVKLIKKHHQNKTHCPRTTYHCTCHLFPISLTLRPFPFRLAICSFSLHNNEFKYYLQYFFSHVLGGSLKDIL